MDKLGKLLPKVLARQPNAIRVAELRVRQTFAELVGPELAGYCESIELRGSTLTVTTSNPALAHQLRLDSGELMTRLNENPPGRKLRAIKVRTGRAAGRPV